MANDDSTDNRNPSHDDAAITTKEVAGTGIEPESEIGALVRKELESQLAVLVPKPPKGLVEKMASMSLYDLEKIYAIVGILFLTVVTLKLLFGGRK